MTAPSLLIWLTLSSVLFLVGPGAIAAASAFYREYNYDFSRKIN